MPTDLQGAIGDLVHGTTLVHYDSSVSYAIREDPTNPARVILRVTRRYSVRNYGKATIPYAPIMAEESFHNPRFLSLELFYGENLISRMGETDFSIELAPESYGVSVKGPSINLEPYNVDSAADYRPALVVWKVELNVPNNYSDVTSFVFPTVGTFEIRKEAVPDNYDFDASRDAEMSFADGGTLWRYHRAYLPKQHLRVWWRPQLPSA